MSWRLVAVGVVVALSLGGCAGFDTAPAGFGETVVLAEGPAPGSNIPTPTGAPSAWSTTMVIPVIAGPRAVAEADGPYLLDTGDKLRVFVYGQPNLSRIYTVDHDGKISVPLIGHVRARGRTTGALEGAIRSSLGAQYVKDPHVTIDISQNRPFYILGEVRSAGQFPYISGMTVQSAVAVAGGFSERANEHHIQITRRTNGLVEKMDVPGDYVVQPGDTVYVYERWF